MGTGVDHTKDSLIILRAENESRIRRLSTGTILYPSPICRQFVFPKILSGSCLFAFKCKPQ